MYSQEFKNKIKRFWVDFYGPCNRFFSIELLQLSFHCFHAFRIFHCFIWGFFTIARTFSHYIGFFHNIFVSAIRLFDFLCLFQLFSAFCIFQLYSIIDEFFLLARFFSTILDFVRHFSIFHLLSLYSHSSSL